MGLSTTYTKIETDFLLQKLESELASGIKGSLKIIDTAPTVQGLYILSDVGTYINLGGLITTTGKINYAYFDGTTWSLVSAQIPNYSVNTVFNPTDNTKGSTDKAVADFVDIKTSDIKAKSIEEDLITWKLANDLEFFTGSYGYKNIAQYTKKMTSPSSFNIVKINQVRSDVGVNWCTYKVYIVNDPTVGLREVPIGAISSGTHTLINEGKILASSSFSDFNIELDKMYTCPVGSQVVIYISSIKGDMIFIKGTGGGAGNPEKTSNAALICTTANPFVDSWVAGSVNDTTNTGYFSVAPTLLTTKTFVLRKNYIPEIYLPNRIVSIIGDKLQIFYRGIIKAINPYNFDIKINCSKGSSYPRYFEYTPQLGDSGDYPFNIKIKDNYGNVLVDKTCILEVKNAGTSPSTQITALAVGDSLTSNGEWVSEVNRRLKGTGGTPSGRGFTNIFWKGRKPSGLIFHEGNGGWSWASYATSGQLAYRFIVSGITTPPSLGSTYTNNGVTFTIDEINITSGSGNIRGTYLSGVPNESGVLTKVTGSGDVTINFSSSTAEAGNPFWNNTTNQLDFKNYVDTWMSGYCDVVYFLLSWNSQSPHKTDFTTEINYAKTIFNHIKANYPSIKIKLMGVQVPSLNGGFGANYGATGNYSDAYGMVVTALNQNKAYQDLANDLAYSSFVEFVNVSSQFDSENNMPEADTPVNSRSTKTEKRGTNGVHPSNEGYMQIADVVYRNFVGRFCQ